MQKKNFSSVGIVLGIIMIFGITSFAFADWGWGHHRGMGQHHAELDRHGNGYGHHRMMDGENNQELTKEETEALNKEREAFLQSTKDLRQQIDEKRIALRNELAKESPNTETAAGLQAEISELQATLDQKRLEHQIAVKQINPNAGMRFANKSGQGYGHGYCWR